MNGLEMYFYVFFHKVHKINTVVGHLCPSCFISKITHTDFD